MGAFSDFIQRKLGKTVTLINDNPEVERIGSIVVPEKLTELNAFKLANSVSEINFPIDFLADRISKLRFYIENSRGKEQLNTELNRFISDDINPFSTFSDLVYQFIFSYLSNGNVFTYTGVPDIYKTANTNSITRIDILNPDLVDIDWYDNLSTLKQSNIIDFIKKVEYDEGKIYDKQLKKEMLNIVRYDSVSHTYQRMLSRSPLFKCQGNINNLLATYSARYNIYVNNGAAGYLSRKTSSTTNLENFNPVTRDAIVDEINSRNGLTGKRHLWGISAVPLEFVKTMADIQALMPFEETLEDSIKIAGIFNIPPELVPRKDQSTFNNKDTAERSVWENILTSLAQLFADNWGKITTINKVGYKIGIDYSTVGALKQNETDKQDLLTKELANLKTMLEINPEKSTEIKEKINTILTDGKGK